MTGQPKICQHLRDMNRLETLDALEFNNYLAGNDQVDAVAGIELNAFVKDGHLDLASEGQPA